MTPFETILQLCETELPSIRNAGKKKKFKANESFVGAIKCNSREVKLVDGCSRVSSEDCSYHVPLSVSFATLRIPFGKISVLCRSRVRFIILQLCFLKTVARIVILCLR